MARDDGKSNAEWRELKSKRYTTPRVVYPVCYQCGRLASQWWGIFADDGTTMAICRRCIEEKPS